MRKFLIMLCMLLPFGLGGCFQSEEEAALELVQNGYLDADKSAPIGQMIAGYRYFHDVDWSYFKTEQGQQIVEVSGIIDLWDHMDDRKKSFINAGNRQILSGYMSMFGYDFIKNPKFQQVLEKFQIQTKATIQFTILPEDRFEVSYQGQELLADSDKISVMPEAMKKHLKIFKPQDPTILGQVYENELVLLPSETIMFFREFKKQKRKPGSIYNRAETPKLEAQQNMQAVMPNLIPSNKSPNFIEGMHYTEANGGVLMLFREKSGRWHGIVDTSTMRTACSVAGTFMKTQKGFDLEKVYDLDGTEKAATCQMSLTSTGSKAFKVRSNCHEQYCGMGGYLDGDYQQDFDATISSTDALIDSKYGNDLPPTYVMIERK